MKPYISLDPAVQGGRACIGGTQILAVALVAEYWNGLPYETKWPCIGPDEVVMSAWYVCNHGHAFWYRRWHYWLREVEEDLKAGKSVKLPPRVIDTVADGFGYHKEIEE